MRGLPNVADGAIDCMDGISLTLPGVAFERTAYPDRFTCEGTDKSPGMESSKLFTLQ